MGNSNSVSSTRTSATPLVLLIIGIILLLAVVLVLVVILIVKRFRLKRRRFEVKAHAETQAKNGFVNPSFSNGNGVVSLSHITNRSFRGEGQVNTCHAQEPFKPVPIDENRVLDCPTPDGSPKMEPITIVEFAKYVSENKINGALVDQWTSLPQDLTHPAINAEKTENKVKNRYRNILAYDHSRVILEKKEDDNFSDYINASYINGFNKEKAYIASQGPISTSIEDFWRMIWQLKIKKVVMAARVIEEGKMKCMQYWSKIGDDPQSIGDFTINTDLEEKRDCYTLRQLTVSMSGTTETLQVYQFHYTQWPDRDVPSDASTVLRFLRDIHNFEVTDLGPVLIHCSAGAGRTGALIAIDSQLQRAKVKGDLDVYNFIHDLRNARPWMVQTPIQYLFVHEAIVESLYCGDTLIPASSFAHYMKELKRSQYATGQSLLEQQFEALNAVSVKVTPQFWNMQIGSHCDTQNRFPDIIPIDRFRPKLLSIESDEDSDYICASFLNGYMKIDQFICSQMPLPYTLVDFFRLIKDYNITTVVMLNQMEFMNDEKKKCAQYWPSDGTPLSIGSFSMEEEAVKSSEHFLTRDLALKHMDLRQEIRQFQFLSWPSDDTDPSAVEALLDFILAVQERMTTKGQEKHPLLIHCINGVGNTGVVCSVINCLLQLRERQSANVFNIIKSLRRKQPLLVQTQGEFELIHKLIHLYLSRLEATVDV